VAIARAVDASVQTGGGVRDGSLLDDGVARVVVGSLAIKDPGATRELLSAYPGRVAVGLDHRDGQVLTHGWEQGSGRAVRDVATDLGTADVAAFVVTDVSRDAMLQGPDVEGLASLAAELPVPVIASGGVSSLDDLRALRATGVAGAIVGKALYENRFTVAEALAETGS
jgi:phosphoribosylformimino-5-aminoimidazole carboxamide ribotide isomerase